MTFGKFSSVGTMNKRNMGIMRQFPIHGLKNMELTKHIRQMVVSPNYVGNSHIMIIHDNRKIEGGCSIGSQKDHVIQLLIRDAYFPLDKVMNDGIPCLRGFKTNDGFNSFR